MKVNTLHDILKEKLIQSYVNQSDLYYLFNDILIFLNYNMLCKIFN